MLSSIRSWNTLRVVDEHIGRVGLSCRMGQGRLAERKLFSVIVSAGLLLAIFEKLEESQVWWTFFYKDFLAAWVTCFDRRLLLAKSIFSSNFRVFWSGLNLLHLQCSLHLRLGLLFCLSQGLQFSLRLSINLLFKGQKLTTRGGFFLSLFRRRFKGVNDDFCFFYYCWRLLVLDFFWSWRTFKSWELCYSWLFLGWRWGSESSCDLGEGLRNICLLSLLGLGLWFVRNLVIWAFVTTASFR
jgi:hypothetical protein